MSVPSANELEELVCLAWGAVGKEHPTLIEAYADTGCHIERALAFRLGLALDGLMREARPRWSDPWSSVIVDNELHRAHDGCKLDLHESPDLIVHVRGSDEANLLVLELKHAQDPSASDVGKLERLVTERRYRYGWAVRLDGDRRPVIREAVR